jgi:hypothetical protein
MNKWRAYRFSKLGAQLADLTIQRLDLARFLVLGGFDLNALGTIRISKQKPAQRYLTQSINK